MGEDRFITTPDGRKIRAMIHGNGPTLVVLDAGLGANGFYWSKTYKLLAEKLPNVCIVAYDRAGMGASDPDPRPRTLAHMADDLDTIIDSFVPRQVFLIGHSWGGTLAQFAAARRRAAGRTITGVMLVDSSTRTNQYSSLKVRASVALAPPILRLLGRTRLAKLAMFKLGAGLPRPLRNAAIAGSASRTATEAAAAEAELFLSEIDWLSKQPLRLDGVDVCVISGMKGSKVIATNQINAGCYVFRRELIAAHQKIAAAGRWVPATKSAHNIPLSEPELIAEQIMNMVDRARVAAAQEPVLV